MCTRFQVHWRSIQRAWCRVLSCLSTSHSAVSWGWKLGNYLPWRSDKGNICGLEEEASGVEVRAAFDEWQECVKGCYSSTYCSQKVLCPVHDGSLPREKVMQTGGLTILVQTIDTEKMDDAFSQPTTCITLHHFILALLGTMQCWMKSIVAQCSCYLSA